jgi:hypothetical protein
MSNNWHADGAFPPLAEKCEAFVYADTVSKGWVEGWREGEAFAADMGLAAIFCSGSLLHIIESPSHFRPIKSEREKTVDALIDYCKCHHGFGEIEEYRYVFEEAFDKGFLKMPEDL